MELCRLIVVCGFIFGSSWCYDFRLPNDTVPVAYSLIITPFFGNNSFKGRLNITFSVANPTRQIVLHARNLTIDVNGTEIISADDLFPGNVEVNSTEFDENNSLFIVNTVTELEEQQFVLSINYTGIIQEEMAGFSVASYDINGTSKYIGVTHFEPTHARSVFPCYDEPRYRTNFALEVVVPSSHSVISNVPVSRTTVLSNNTRSFYFQEYRQMPTYLLAWVIYDEETYFNVSSTVSGVTINTWARQGFLDQTSYANATSGTILATLWSYLNTPSGSTKIDQVAIPNFFIGAMENWGLITYAEDSLLYKNVATTTQDLQKISLTVAHELTHQWFGDLVTVESWNYPWLKEAFAQYFQYNVTGFIQPSWQLSDQIVVNLIQPALELDSTPQHALNNFSLASEKQISLMFDDITYNKGAALIRMVQSIFGEEAFRLGLQVHFKKSQNGVTNPTKLWTNLNVAAKNKKVYLGGGNLDVIMEGWTNNSGHPVVSVVKTESGVYNITQKRFLFDAVENSSWWIPLTYITQAEKGVVTKVFLPGNKVLLANISGSNNGWVLFNVNQTGFYRVLYDKDNLQLLSNQLQSDLTQIPRINRAQLLDDMFSFARGGFVSYAELLNFTTFLQKEVDYIPWVTAVRNFGYLLKRFYSQPSVYDLLKEYVLGLMQKVISNVGFQEAANEGHLQKLKRVLILEQACSLGHTDCVGKATQYLKDWKNGIVSSSADIQRALLCTAVQYGDSVDWDFVFNQYLVSTVPTQKAAILSSLTCSQNGTKLNEFLDSIFTNTTVVSSKEFTAVMKSLSSKPVGAVILLDYIFNRDYCLNNTLSVPSDYEEEVLVGVLSQILPQLSSKDEIMKLSAYALNGTCLSNNTAEQLHSLASTGFKTILWQEQYNTTIYNWLLQQKSAPPVTEATPTNPSMSGESRLTVQYANIILCIFVSFMYIIYN